MISFLGILLGLINPNISMFWLKNANKRTRGLSALIYGAAFLCFFVLIDAVSLFPGSSPNTASVPSLSKTVATQPAQQAAPPAVQDDQQVQVPESPDVKIYNKVFIDFMDKGITLSDKQPTAKGTEHLEGSNNDSSLTLSIYKDPSGSTKSYELMAVTSTIPDMILLLKDVLPESSTVTNWLNQHLNTPDWSSTTDGDAHIKLLMNNWSSDEVSYLLEIFPQGDENL
jgi:hypothetical protein